MKKGILFVALLVSILLTISCENKNSASKGKSGDTASTPPHSLSDVEFVSVTGKVVEFIEGNEFTYIKLQTDVGEKWLAVPLTEVAEGEQISIVKGEKLRNFPSKTVGRTFDELIVAGGIEGKPLKKVAPDMAGEQQQESHEGLAKVAADMHGPNDGHGHDSAAADSFAAAMQAERGAAAQGKAIGGQQQKIDPAMLGSNKAIVPFVDLKVEKAAGNNGYTVGELFDKSNSLNKKTIRVRGQIVKVSMNIMGKNWLHIQDGTGDTLKNSHDLVVTTKENPAKGEIVVVEGTLSSDRDFGAGYRYPVIVEDAKILEK